jgi:APA family basic amino acid/polyamine antiporter
LRLFAAVKLLLLAAIIVLGFVSAHGTWSNFLPFARRARGRRRSSPAGRRRPRRLLRLRRLLGHRQDRRGDQGSGGPCRGRWPSRRGRHPRLPAGQRAFIRLVPMENGRLGPAFRGAGGAALFAGGGGRVFAVIVMIAIAGSLSAVIVTAPRVSLAMARDGYHPAAIGRLHPRLGTPVRRIALQALLSCLVVGLANYDAILGYFVFITVVFLALTVAGSIGCRAGRRGVSGWPDTLDAAGLSAPPGHAPGAARRGPSAPGRPRDRHRGAGYPCNRLIVSPRAARLAEEVP